MNQGHRSDADTYGCLVTGIRVTCIALTTNCRSRERGDHTAGANIRGSPVYWGWRSARKATSVIWATPSESRVGAVDTPHQSKIRALKARQERP